MAYGARLESVLGASPQGFESLILRKTRACRVNDCEASEIQRQAGRSLGIHR